MWPAPDSHNSHKQISCRNLSLYGTYSSCGCVHAKIFAVSNNAHIHSYHDIAIAKILVISLLAFFCLVWVLTCVSIIFAICTYPLPHEVLQKFHCVHFVVWADNQLPVKIKPLEISHYSYHWYLRMYLWLRVTDSNFGPESGSY